MISSILVVCVGNICRSPTAAKILKNNFHKLRIESSGIGAVVGSPASKKTQDIAMKNGINLDGHIARQFSNTLASEFDLILALETEHLKHIYKVAPEIRGKAMLLGHWLEEKNIPDPHGKSLDFHAAIFKKISEACESWIIRVEKK